MFKGCTSLTKSPDLEASELKDGCYMGMFDGCTSLYRVKVGFADWYDGGGAEYDFDNWPTLNWLANTDSFTINAKNFYCPSDLDVTNRDDSHVPNGWLVVEVPKTGIMSLSQYEKLYSEDDPVFAVTFTGLDFEPQKDVDYAVYRDPGEDVLADGASYTIHAVWINKTAGYHVDPVTNKLTIKKKNAKLVADEKSIASGQKMPSLTAHTEGFRQGVDVLASDDYAVDTHDNGNGSFTLTPRLTEKGSRFLQNYNIEMVASVLKVYSTGGSGGGVATQVIDNGEGGALSSETAMTSTYDKKASSNDEGTQSPFNPLTIASLIANAALLVGLIFVILKFKKVF